MFYCDTPNCAGHSGKFPDCTTEALWEMALDGFDESTGDSEFQGYYTLIILPGTETHQITDGAAVTIPAGAYMVCTYNSGAVSSERFDSEAHAREAFRVKDEAYSEWLDAEDDEAYGECLDDVEYEAYRQA